MFFLSFKVKTQSLFSGDVVILIYPSKASDQAQFGQEISGVARLALQCPFIRIKRIFRSLHAGSRATDFDQEFSSREGESGLVQVGHGHIVT